MKKLLIILPFILFSFISFPAPSHATTEILRPNGAGDSTQFTKTGCTSNYQCVYEETADGDTSHVDGGVSEVCGGVNFSIAIEENSVITLAAKTVTTSYANYFNQWSTRPSDGGSWTITDINTLQAGIKVVGDYNTSLDLYNIFDSNIPVGSTINFVKVYTNAKCKTGALGNARATQVYVEVDYTPTAPSTAPSRMMRLFEGFKIKFTSGRIIIQQH